MQVLRFISLFAVIACASASAWAQQTASHRYVPPELQISDPEVKALVDSVEKMQQEGKYSESFHELQKALDLSVSRGSLADKGLIEAKLGATYFLQGRLEDARQQWVNSISDSLKTNNLVLQTDTLVALASMAQVSGNLAEAIDLAGKALVLARRSKNLFIQSRCLGELGRLQLTMGKREEARASVEEALRMDRLNQYNWEAAHLLYLAWITYSTSKLDDAIQLASSARELAIKEENYLVFMQASESLGQAYVSKKQLSQAISLLEHSREGKSETGEPLFEHPDSYRAAVSLPYPRIVFLEAIALAYQAGQRADEALKTWQELYDVAQAAGFTLAAAGAAHGMADICNAKNEAVKAVAYYQLAAEAWAKGGNIRRRIDALASEAYLLSKEGEADQAISLYEELLPLARSTNNASREFLFDLAIAEITQPKGDLDRTGRALQGAESLLSPNLAVGDVEPKFILWMYLRLADWHEKRSEALEEMVAFEKAMTPAEAISRESLSTVVLAVGKRLSELKMQEAADKAYQGGDLAEALTAFELIQHFEEADAKVNGKSDEYKKNLGSDPIIGRILDIPFKLIAHQDGASALEKNLHEMGPIAQMAKLPALLVLSSYYIVHQQPDMAVKFATAALPQLRLGEQDQPQMIDGQIACALANSLLLDRKVNSALQRIEPCLRVAKKLGDPRLLVLAHQTNVWILDAAGKQDQASESMQFLLQHTPADPSLYAEEAQLCTQQGKVIDAIQAWKRALQLFEARNDPSGAASVHLSIANSLGSMNTQNAEKEDTHLEAALTIYERFRKKQESNKARTYFAAALKLSRQAKKPDLEARVLSQMGQLYLSAEPAKALELYRQAEFIYHTLNDAADEALQLRNEAWALDGLQKPEDALEMALKAKRIADASGSWIARYWACRLLGSLYAERGEYESGLTAVREARAISDSANQPLNSAWAASALAIGLITIGDWAEAQAQVQYALPIFREFNDTNDEFAGYSQLIEIYGARESDLRDFGKALEYYQSAYQLVQDKDKASAANLALTVEEIYWQQGRFKEAISKAADALEYYQQINDEWDQANALMSLAEAQRSDGDILTAALNLVRAEPLVKRSHNYYMTGRYFYGQANQRKAEGRFKEAIAEYEHVIEMLERFKSSSDASVRRKVSETYGFIYDELIDAYYSLGNPTSSLRALSASKALEYAELNKSRVFTSTWGRTFVEALQRQLPARLQEKERKLLAKQESLQSEMERSMSGRGERSTKAVRNDLEVLSKELRALQQEIRQANPAYAEASYPQPVSILGMPVRPGETLIEFKFLKGGLMVWIILGTKNAAELRAFYNVGHPREWFEERVLAIRNAFNRAQPDQFDPRASEELFNSIFPTEYAQYVTNAKSIVFIPDDILFLLPFEMLSPKASQGQFVFLKTPTTYFPSAAALRLSRAVLPTRSGWPAQFFGLADPITSASDERYAAASVLAEADPLTSQPKTSDAQLPGRELLPADLKLRDYFFSRLPDTATEISSIAGLFPSDSSAAVVRTGVDARKRELLRTDLGRFRFLHFATHGFFPVEPGIREPALVLSYEGKDQSSMMLTLSEVLQLRLHAEMVVLSACNTGSGKVTRAEGVTSLGTAFLAAGASSTTVSLWKVSDKSTAILMQEFYRNLLSGMSKNAALAAARTALVTKGYANPFYWAPFVLTGE